MHIEVLTQAFDPWQRLQAYQAQQVTAGSYGATAVFVGTMRDFNVSANVQAMTLEHYPGMTEKYLEAISRTAAERWAVLDSLILHRVGELTPNDPIVLVAVWSAHRKDAFEASRWLMEGLKSKAPFWKKEQLVSGATQWVEKNTEGY